MTDHDIEELADKLLDFARSEGERIRNNRSTPQCPGASPDIDLLVRENLIKALHTDLDGKS